MLVWSGLVWFDTQSPSLSLPKVEFSGDSSVEPYTSVGLRIVYLFYQPDNHDDITALARDLVSLFYSDFGYVLVDRYTNVY